MEKTLSITRENIVTQTGISKHLNVGQLNGLRKLGDVMLPGDPAGSGMPGFAEAGCESAIDRVLDYMPAGDLNDLKMLLGMMSWWPRFFIAFFLWLLERSPGMPDFIGAPLRFIRLGMRGLVMTLYYSNPRVIDKIGYQVCVYTGDMK